MRDFTSDSKVPFIKCTSVFTIFISPFHGFFYFHYFSFSRTSPFPTSKLSPHHRTIIWPVAALIMVASKELK